MNGAIATGVLVGHRLTGSDRRKASHFFCSVLYGVLEVAFCQFRLLIANPSHDHFDHTHWNSAEENGEKIHSMLSGRNPRPDEGRVNSGNSVESRWYPGDIEDLNSTHGFHAGRELDLRPSAWPLTGNENDEHDNIGAFGVDEGYVLQSTVPSHEGHVRFHGPEIALQQPQPQRQPRVLLSERSSLTPLPTMANQGYPPSSYSGSHTPIFPADAPGGPNDPYPPGTHFFHTDFLPISPSETQDQDPASTAQLMAIEEEKRRRNTAASARFRLKKKEREQALEKTAVEMTDRVRDLEQKVGQLELENKWLRGLIVERRRKMSTAAEEEEGEGSGARRKSADVKKKSGKKGSKDLDLERNPRKRNDGVGTE